MLKGDATAGEGAEGYVGDVVSSIAGVGLVELRAGLGE